MTDDTFLSEKFNDKKYPCYQKVASFFIFAINSVGTGASSKSREKQYSADIVIYRGTSAAIIAAVEAVHSGKSVLVVLLPPSKPYQESASTERCLSMQLI
ncbi:MAG: hypothetical protein M0Q53_00955 [Prolixibacteraceae bacterium]|jgi:hypothetical protein|nr:hypothetical protein [Prolixibacteraceae bacterium]